MRRLSAEAFWSLRFLSEPFFLFTFSFLTHFTFSGFFSFLAGFLLTTVFLVLLMFRGLNTFLFDERGVLWQNSISVSLSDMISSIACGSTDSGYLSYPSLLSQLLRDGPKLFCCFLCLDFFWSNTFDPHSISVSV